MNHKGQDYIVEVKSGGDISSIQVAGQAPAAPQVAEAQAATPAVNAEDILAPLAGNIWKVLVSPNQQINEGDTLVILEAMKMETTIKTPKNGTIKKIFVKNGDKVQSGEPLFEVVD